MSRKIIVAALLCAALAALFPLRRPAPRPQEPRTAAAAPRVHWPLGRRYTYALSWRATTGGEVAPGQDGKSTVLAMESAVDGEISLERSGGSLTHAQVALTWKRFDKFSFAMQGHDAQGDLAQVSRALAGQPAFLEVDDRGRIGSIAFAPEMAPGARSVLRSLALQLRYTLPESEAAEWEADEQDSLGEVHVRYRSGAGEMAREDVAYRALDAVRGALDGTQKLSGGAVLALDADGVPESIEETVEAVYTRKGGTSPAVRSAWSFTLHRTGQAVATPVLETAARQAQPQPLRAQVADGDRESRHDQHLAEGMSLDHMLEVFDRFETGTRPGHQVLVKAAAWLRLHPGDLQPMVSRFTSRDLTVKGRGLILDVLAETGNARAQEAMRAALSSRAARESPRDFSRLVQRFTFVIAPSPESIRFLEQSYDEMKRDPANVGAEGAAVALGSSVRRLHDQHEDDLAGEVGERLRADLRTAQTPGMRGALVAALGNAGRKEDVPDLLAVASDPDVRVRDQVATALRTVDAPEARSGLLTLAVDPSSEVARSAFDSLKAQSLQDEDWQALSKLAQGGRTPVAADPALVELVRAKGASRAESREILSALLKRNQSPDSDLPGIIRALLQEGKGG